MSFAIISRLLSSSFRRKAANVSTFTDFLRSHRLGYFGSKKNNHNRYSKACRRSYKYKSYREQTQRLEEKNMSLTISKSILESLDVLTCLPRLSILSVVHLELVKYLWIFSAFFFFRSKLFLSFFFSPADLLSCSPIVVDKIEIP